MIGPVLLHPSRDRGRWQAALTAQLPEAQVIGPDDDFSAVRYAMLWRLPPSLFAHAVRLEVLFVLGAGIDHLTGQVPENITMVRLEDAGMVPQMVEYHLYAVLHYFRGFDRFAAQQQSHSWQPWPPPAPAALRVRILGHGVLGRAVAEALRERGFDVASWARRPRPDPHIRHGAAGLQQTLSEADILIVLLPLTPQTDGLLDARRLAWLPPGAAIINAARGALLPAEPLLQALDAGRLRGAFLDVAPQEPLPAEHPLWSHPRVVLTPHVAAMTRPEPSVARVVANIRRHQRGAAMSGVVTSAGY